MMEVLKVNRLELAVCGSTASFQESLDSQKELFHSQIDQLQTIIVTQCKLTGVNPLSQEMAAGALSIEIGKRPRDLLNPKAVKYMQSVVSIKDAITKKESREISALFGVAVSQVREFFTSQRSRVRKFVRLSREKALRSNASKEVQDGVPMSTDPTTPIYPVPLSCVGPASSEERPCCSRQDETLPGLDDSNRHFLENIFSFMRKEETFSGQVKLMEWILQIQNSSVLYWFLTKGGVMILATWLSQAAIEEQTSVLHVILKVLCHLPLHKALPVHMSAILQSVNRLRFYRTSDISNRARILLSRWSKIFARSQAMKKPNAVKSSTEAQNEMLLKQSINEIMDDESWESKVDVPENTLAPSFEGSENSRKLDFSQPLKLLPPCSDDSSKKLIRGVSSSQTRERRKVLLVEQPGQKQIGRSLHVARSVNASQGRPLSADDIQKAKMRAQFMQSKHGKSSASSGEGHQAKTEVPTILSSSQEAPLCNMMNLDLDEPSWKKCKKVQTTWQTPAEIRIQDVWRVGTGENSKEVEVQRNRIRRERETIYWTCQEVPSDPKEPWDREMDYDDSLTPEIPTKQPPDADGVETVASPRENEISAVAVAAASSQNSIGSMPEPDLELLAVLLKHPELVFALTSGQGGSSWSSEETMKLLDMIKANGVASLGSLTGLGRNAEESVQVSLPSPTPSSDPVTNGWRPEVGKNPFSLQSETANRETISISEVAVSIPTQEKLPASVPTLSQQAMPLYSLPQTATVSERVLDTKDIPVNSSPLPPNLAAAAALPSMRVETSGYVKPAPISIALNTTERQPVAFPSAPLFPKLTQPRAQPSLLVPEPLLSTHSWRATQAFNSNPRQQSNHNNYNAFVGGPARPGGSDFESWSPENSPIRSTEYTCGWNYPEPRTNMGHNYRPEPDRDRSRPRNSSGYRDYNRHGSRRWRDRRR